MDPDLHPFADDKPKCMEYEPISALIQGFEPLLGSQDPYPDPHQRYDPVKDSHQIDKQDPDPHQKNADPQQWVRLGVTK